MSGPPIVHDDTPPQSGIYVAYVNGPEGLRFADRIILFWDAPSKRWGYPHSDQLYREHVYGWIGPLPVMKLVEPSEQPGSEAP